MLPTLSSPKCTSQIKKQAVYGTKHTYVCTYVHKPVVVSCGTCAYIHVNELCYSLIEKKRRMKYKTYSIECNALLQILLYKARETQEIISHAAWIVFNEKSILRVQYRSKNQL